MPTEPAVRSVTPGTGKTTRVYILVLGDFVLSLACYILAASIVEREFDLFWLSVNENAWRFLTVVILSMQSSLLLQGLYAQPRLKGRIEFLLSLLQALGVCLLMGAVLVYWLPAWRLPVGTVLLGGVLNVAALFGWRVLFSAVCWGVGGFCRILFVGASPVTREVAARLSEHPEQGFSISGFLDQPATLPAGLSAKILGPPSALAEQYTRVRPDRIVVGMVDPRAALPVRALLDLRAAGAPIQRISDLYETVFRRVSVAELRPSQLIFLGDYSARPGQVALQSIYVNLLAMVLVVLMSPVMLVIAIVIKLTSNGPVLERNTCVGFEGLPFLRLTFRCTVTGAAKVSGSVERRLTPIGQWLRRSHLHKLPELLNVLRGEMSLVGPRPHRVEFVEALSALYPYYRQRHIAKPGITGWAQINLKESSEAVDERIALEYDLYYIKHLSPTLDLYILLHSLW